MISSQLVSKMKFAAVALCVLFVATVSASIEDDDEIFAYHFHTYYFQDDAEEKAQAASFRQTIIGLVSSGVFAECAVNRFNERPIGPHPVGSFETCCNKTSVPMALSWFMKNHGNHSILLHPLTRLQLVDHTESAMWLGEPYPLVLGAVRRPLAAPERCPDLDDIGHS
ncbi:Dopa 4,5-dioxygenase [Halotydeus destructor]|nr:Dopa 4,5-dioxygenase [Halotydeus destructor]